MDVHAKPLVAPQSPCNSIEDGAEAREWSRGSTATEGADARFAHCSNAEGEGRRRGRRGRGEQGQGEEQAQTRAIELSDPALPTTAADLWRGGGRVRGRKGGGGDEEEGSRGQARRRTEQLGSELTPLIPAPGTDRSDGKGAATGLV